MKKVYLVHCWDGTCDDGWYPWIEDELKKYNVKVIRFNMPNTSSPEINSWVNTLKDKVELLNEDIYFIGHSIGCQTILRYLEDNSNARVGGMLLVAPWLELLPKAIEDEESFNIANPWINTPIDFKKINKVTNNIYCLFSSDDYFVPFNQEEIFRKLLNSKNYIVKNKGHISQDDGIFKLDEILNICIKMLDLK